MNALDLCIYYTMRNLTSDPPSSSTHNSTQQYISRSQKRHHLRPRHPNLCTNRQASSSSPRPSISRRSNIQPQRRRHAKIILTNPDGFVSRLLRDFISHPKVDNLVCVFVLLQSLVRSSGVSLPCDVAGCSLDHELHPRSGGDDSVLAFEGADEGFYVFVVCWGVFGLGVEG